MTAVFDLIRKANIFIKDEKLRADDAKRLLSFVYQLDDVLAVLPPRRTLLIDAAIRAKIDERERARKGRDFRRADEIRRELLQSGIVLEDTKDGVRWKSIKTGA